LPSRHDAGLFFHCGFRFFRCQACAGLRVLSLPLSPPRSGRLPLFKRFLAPFWFSARVLGGSLARFALPAWRWNKIACTVRANLSRFLFCWGSRALLFYTKTFLRIYLLPLCLCSACWRYVPRRAWVLQYPCIQTPSTFIAALPWRAGGLTPTAACTPPHDVPRIPLVHSARGITTELTCRHALLFFHFTCSDVHWPVPPRYDDLLRFFFHACAAAPTSSANPSTSFCVRRTTPSTVQHGLHFITYFCAFFCGWWLNRYTPAPVPILFLLCLRLLCLVSARCRIVLVTAWFCLHWGRLFERPHVRYYRRRTLGLVFLGWCTDSVCCAVHRTNAG